MELLPINRLPNENQVFLTHPECREILLMTLDFYTKVGFNPPWISYYAHKEGQLVGGGGFKGKPLNGQVEIAYGTFPQYRHQGIGTEICSQLVSLCLQTDATIRITARTLPENAGSARILKKNGFQQVGII